MDDSKRPMHWIRQIQVYTDRFLMEPGEHTLAPLLEQLRQYREGVETGLIGEPYIPRKRSHD